MEKMVSGLSLVMKVGTPILLRIAVDCCRACPLPPQVVKKEQEEDGQISLLYNM